MTYDNSSGQFTTTVGPERITLLFTEHDAILRGSTYDCACGFSGDLADISSHMRGHKAEREAGEALLDARLKERAEAQRAYTEAAAEAALVKRLSRFGRVTRKGSRRRVA